MENNKTIHSIPVEKFKSDTDDFESWIELFEAAIEIAYNGATDAERRNAARRWLPLKLDDKARNTLTLVNGETWELLKENLQKALINPQDENKWRSRTPFIVWDGIESFQCLGTRVKRAVNRLHKGDKESEYYHRFADALPLDYQFGLNLGVPKDQRTIENAIDVADRVHTGILLKNTTTGTTGTAKTVSFTGAAMDDDRLKSLELAVQGMSVRMESMEAIQKGSEGAPLSRKDEARREFSSSRDRGSSRDRRPDSRDRRDRRDSYERDRRDHSREDRRRDDRDRYRAYNDSPYRGRSRRDSYDRRDYGGQSRDYRDQSRDYRRNDYRRDNYRSPSYQRSRNYDSRDRQYNGRYDSRDRQHDSRDRRYDSRDRQYDSRDRRTDSRDHRNNNGNSWGRQNSWDRGNNRNDQNRDNYRSPRRDDGRQNNETSQHRLAEFGEEWINAAIVEKRAREAQGN